MSQKTDSQLRADATIIKNETAEGANTATRVGQMLIDIVDSKPNNDEEPPESTMIVLWDFAENSGEYPTDPNKLYIATESSIVPTNTWFVANTPTPTGAGDFLYK
jgi:hypothetical protein